MGENESDSYKVSGCQCISEHNYQRVSAKLGFAVLHG